MKNAPWIAALLLPGLLSGCVDPNTGYPYRVTAQGTYQPAYPYLSGSYGRGLPYQPRPPYGYDDPANSAANQREHALQAQYAAQEEQQRQAAAEAAEQATLRAAPRASASSSQRLEKWVAQDSLGWYSNKFDPGSLTNVVVLPNAADGTTVLHGDYTYNGGQSGWVEAHLAHGTLSCLRYWDASDACEGIRPPQPPSAPSQPGNSNGESNYERAQEEKLRQEQDAKCHDPNYMSANTNCGPGAGLFGF